MYSWRPLSTWLTIAAWVFLQCPWVMALPLLGHPHASPHQASLAWAHGHVDLILHHRASDDRSPSCDGAAIVAADGSHSDHVVHPLADQYLRSKGTDPAPGPLPFAATACGVSGCEPCALALSRAPHRCPSSILSCRQTVTLQI